MSSAGSDPACRDGRDYFFSLAERMGQMLRADEVYTCEYRGEDSTFVRLNRGKVGHAGEVRQRQLELDLVRGRKHAGGRINLTGALGHDLAALRRLIDRLRTMREAAVEDPFLHYNTDLTAASETLEANRLPNGDAVLDTIDAATQSGDLVGIYAGGGIHRGFASSLGQRNWHSTFNFNFDWSVFDGTDAAVKAAHAGRRWIPTDVADRIRTSREDLRALRQPRRRVEPGRYRVYLAPAAMHELLSVLSWDGFGVRGWKTRTSPLLRLHDGDNRLGDQVDVAEDIANGTAPAFEASGFPRPGRVPLVHRGRIAERLVSPRSAREFGTPTNGANSAESPNSLDMGAGEIDADGIRQTLHTGLLISNLWYLNFSDRNACRTTGMTRFATMWVENGRALGPVEPMRFDDTPYRMLGSCLVGLTRQRDWILEADSYEWRSTKSARLPGAVIDDLTLTL